MALSTIWALLTQAWIAWCVRLEVEVSRGSSLQEVAFGNHKHVLKKGSDFIGRPNTASLPTLEPEPQYQNQSSLHAHGIGMLFVVNHVPADQNSSQIKIALSAALPFQARLWFISDLDDKHRCFCASTPFEGDVHFFESLTLVVGGVKLKTEVCRGDSLAVGLMLLRKHILEVRENETRKHHEEQKRPIIVGTNLAANVGAFHNHRQEINPPRLHGGYLMSGDTTIFNSAKAAQVDPSHALERVEAVLYGKVTLASNAAENLKTLRTRGEVVKRIVKYIHNAAKQEELRSMNFEEACNHLVEFAMSTYEAAYGDREWFYQLDLAPALAAAAWERLRWRRGLRPEYVQAKIRVAYEEYLDYARLSKDMWEASSNTFEDISIQKKVYEALQKTHKLAFDATIMAVGPEQESERVQNFLKAWINDSMTKAWNSIPDPASVLTKSNVKTLFQNLMLRSRVWEASVKNSNDVSIYNRFYANIHEAYSPAFDAVLTEVRPGLELEQVQDFLKHWIGDSMKRAWKSSPTAGRVLAVSNMSRLFQGMLAPFGHYDLFTTIENAAAKKAADERAAEEADSAEEDAAVGAATEKAAVVQVAEKPLAEMTAAEKAAEEKALPAVEETLEEDVSVLAAGPMPAKRRAAWEETAKKNGEAPKSVRPRFSRVRFAA